MAIKTFTAGSVLTAADTNTYLANSGLKYVSGATISNAPNFYVTGFDTTYDQYRLILSLYRHSGAGSSALVGQFAYNTTINNSGYYGGGVSANYAGAVSSYGARNNGVDMLLNNLYGQDGRMQNCFDIGSMNTTALQATLAGTIYDYALSGMATVAYQATNRTQAWNRLYVSCSANMSGNWILYGYRKA